MTQAILDTSFIMTCTRQKIDFFEEIKLMGIQILIPKQVVNELKGLKAELALKILEKNKFRVIDLKTKNVDRGIKDFADKNKDVIVATLDRGIKKIINNHLIIIRGKKRLEIV